MAGGERRRRRFRQAGRGPGPGQGAGPGQATPGEEPGSESSDVGGPAGAGGPVSAGTQHRGTPTRLADLPDPFALTAAGPDGEPADARAEAPDQDPRDPDHRLDDTLNERGLRGLVGGGSTQLDPPTAMRARDASRPTERHLAAAESDLPIVRRGWVPREDLPRPGHR